MKNAKNAPKVDEANVAEMTPAPAQGTPEKKTTKKSIVITHLDMDGGDLLIILQKQ